MSSIFGGRVSVFDAMSRFFREDDWKVQRIEGKPVLQMGFSGSNGQWNCFAFANEEQQRFSFYSVLQIKVPENKRNLVAELITRANYGLVLGNFEMDYSDGEVRYKTTIDVEGNDGRLPSAQIKTMVYANVVMTDKYLPGIMTVIFGSETPATAIARIEG